MFCRSLFVFLSFFFWPLCLLIKEEFEDIKGVIRIRKSKKNRQHNGQKKKDRQHNDQKTEEQTTQWPKEKGQKDKQRSTKHTYKTKDRVT
jgi:hypothetical protein